MRLLLGSTLVLIVLLAAWAGGSTFELDREISALASDARAAIPVLTPLAAAFTLLGGAPVTLGTALVAVLAVLFQRRTLPALVLATTVLAERALVDWLKETTARLRPDDGALDVGSMAFPSGHAANSMTVFLLVAVIAMPERHRRAAVMAAVLLSIVIGLTRIILGVHWPSDVVGGWALGLLTVGIAAAVARRSEAPGFEAKHEVIGGHGDPLREEETP